MLAPALAPATGFGRPGADICNSSRLGWTIGRTPGKPISGHRLGPSIPGIASIALRVEMLPSGTSA